MGLPNAGKSTLFNALASRRLAETAPRPFTTIDPHEAVVPVPDNLLKRLSKLVKPKETVPATVTFIDIAGLVKGAHKGEGLGNQFLAKIREVDALVHVVRGFIDPYVSHQHITHEPGTLEQILDDIEIVNLELQIAGIKRRPTVYVLNVGEREITDVAEIKRWVVRVTEKFRDPAVVVCAKLEEDLTDLNPKERVEYLKQAGVKKSGLEQLVGWAYELLDLISFYTIKGTEPPFAKASTVAKAMTDRSEGRGEVHAWSIKKGSSAIEAAEIVHTDFAKNFIKAEVIQVEKLLKTGGWKQAKEKGKIRLEGKDYLVQDKDVIEFKVGT